MVRNFYWLAENSIAGCSRPGSSPEGSGRMLAHDEALALDRDLVWLRQREIGALLSLTETPLEEEALARHGLISLHLPVPDLTPPLPDQLLNALDFIDWQQANGRAVAVHCLVGEGRTGTVLAAYLIRGGLSAEEAIARIRSMRSGAIGTPEQARALHAFAARRDWIV